MIKNQILSMVYTGQGKPGKSGKVRELKIGQGKSGNSGRRSGKIFRVYQKYFIVYFAILPLIISKFFARAFGART